MDDAEGAPSAAEHSRPTGEGVSAAEGAPPAHGGAERLVVPAGAVEWFWGDPSAGPPEDAPLQALIFVAARVMGAFTHATVQESGVRVSPAGLGVLRVLLASDGLKSSEVAARGLSTPGTMTSVVDTLVREGYVERRPDPGDRRVVRLWLTDKGRQVPTDYFASAGSWWADAFSWVDPADEPVIRRFLVGTITHFANQARRIHEEKPDLSTYVDTDRAST